jgi:hypothetical protein
LILDIQTHQLENKQKDEQGGVLIADETSKSLEKDLKIPEADKTENNQAEEIDQIQVA